MAKYFLGTEKDHLSEMVLLNNQNKRCDKKYMKIDSELHIQLKADFLQKYVTVLMYLEKTYFESINTSKISNGKFAVDTNLQFCNHGYAKFD